MKRSDGNILKLLIFGLVASLTLITLAGCSASYGSRGNIPERAPRFITPTLQNTAPAQTSNGSLYVDGSRVGQVSDFRAHQVNDLVTIRIIESTQAVNSTNVATEREDTGSRSLTELFGLQNILIPRSVDPTSVIDANTDEEFSSAGTNNRSETVSSTLTARVIDRLPNGNLVIQAIREVIVNSEEQVMVVQGIIRPVDIDDGNTILSNRIADLQINYSGSGVLSENMRRGWFSRFINYVWPF